jgi:DNA-binding NarL/FixJ family response regulator
LGLTDLEHAVASLPIQGFADEQIAEQLGTHTDTVHQNLRSVLRKLGAKSRTEAAVRVVKEPRQPGRTTT